MKTDRKSCCGNSNCRSFFAAYKWRKPGKEVFYEKVVAMKNHVYRITATNEDADKAANATIASV